jgi:hypothetical protein
VPRRNYRALHPDQAKEQDMRKFSLGVIVMTRGVADLVAQDDCFAEFVADCLARHANCDWGADLSDQDRKENEFSLDKNLRIFSSYKQDQWHLWIITESDWSSTCILFPSEY